MLQIFNELDTELIGIYLEHQRVISECQPKYELKETLFAINEPFYMKTEKEALIRDKNQINRKNNKRLKRKLNKKHIYECLLNEPQKQLIIKIFNDMKHTIKQLSINSADNKSSEQMARIALNFNDFYQYSDRLLCNQNNFSVKFNNFIIPPNSSLMCSDVIHGLEIMHKHFIEEKFKISKQFMVVIDPPWISNKSIKRKHFYQTEDNKNILEMTKRLDCLIQLFPKETDIKVCIWSTQKEKEFVVKQMFPILKLKTTHELVWHKITRNGQSCKLRGSLEYLIIGSNNSNEAKCLSGVLVSIPSAIHSHKPPLKELIDGLFNKKGVKSGVNDNSSESDVKIVSTDSEPNPVKNEGLTDSIISYVSGLELYARYLNSGFHSIGFESLKLQNLNLYAIRQK